MDSGDVNDIIFVDDVTKYPIKIKDILEDYHLRIEPEEKKAFLVPSLGRTEWDGHIYVSGATGAGKSYIIRKIVDNDAKKRKCILFTDLDKKDPAFDGMNYVTFHEKDPKYNARWLKDNEHKKIMIFDDVQFNEDILNYRDKILQKGRHKDTTVICVNHKMNDYNKSKVPLTDCRFMICFPCANRGTCSKFLHDEMGLKLEDTRDIIDQTIEDGRPLMIHRFYPNCLASSQSIWRI